LRRALHVDIEQQVRAGRVRLLEKRPRRAVVVLEDFGPLEQSVGGNHALKLLARDEEVFSAVQLPPPWRPRGVGDRELKPGYVSQQAVNERRLSRAGRRGDNEYTRAHALAPPLFRIDPGCFTVDSAPARGASQSPLSYGGPIR